MSSQALLDAIETAGKEELAQLERETRNRVEEIRAEAEKTAACRRETACQDALRPLAAERARRLHEARMEALKITAAAHDQVTQKLLAQIETRLQTLRDQPQYPAVFRQLVEEAIQTLGEREVANDGNTGPPRLEVDGRDAPLVQDMLQVLPVEMAVASELTTWGGVVVRSGDGRIIVTNTLEARLERMKPHLGTFSN